ncbi:hypothetical protein Tco_0709035 [Tanacetum coccineum]
MLKKETSLLPLKSMVRNILASDEFSRVQGELLSLAASASFKRGLKMDQTSEQLDAALKKISHYVPGAQGRLVEATPFVTTTKYPFLKKIVDHTAHPLSVLLQFESGMLTHSKFVPALKATRVSPPLTRESTNEEWAHVMVDTLDVDMVDDAYSKSAEVATFLYPSTSIVGACFLYDAAVHWRFLSGRKVLWTFRPAFCKA